jgi:hypothetical protein
LKGSTYMLHALRYKTRPREEKRRDKKRQEEKTSREDKGQKKRREELETTVICISLLSCFS